MLHVVPILCLIFFVWFVEIQLKREMHNIEREFRELKERIENNRLGIENNREKIEENRNNITKLTTEQYKK